MIGLRAVRAAICGLGVFALASCQPIGPKSASAMIEPSEVDLLISGGIIYDGSGKPGMVGDVAIIGATISAVAPAGKLGVKAKRTIDAKGLIVAPGFIDPHTHAGSDLKAKTADRRANLPYLMQGVTTVMVGNDGDGASDVSRLASDASEMGIGSNVAYLAGFGHIRKEVMGQDDRPASPAELAAMQDHVKRAMCGGAVGFSAGLYYTPQNFAATDEVTAIAKVAARFGGYYDTHIRDESDYSVGLGSALDEAISIGREAEMPVHISHIKALGPSVWGKSKAMIEAIENAQSKGLKVTADQYPWTASGTRISNALVPRWALDGGLPGLRARLKQPETLARIRGEMVQNLKRRGGADKLLLTGNLGQASVSLGKTLGEFANTNDQTALDAAITILRVGDARVASFIMNEQDIEAFAKQNWVMTGSDGSSGHPRKYASYPKAYRDFVIDRKIMSLSRFIERSSGQVADMAGLQSRGYLTPGFAADVLVFDPETFAPIADFQNPRELSRGVIYLTVNGSLVVDRGIYNGALAGKPLLKTSSTRYSECT